MKTKPTYRDCEKYQAEHPNPDLNFKPKNDKGKFIPKKKTKKQRKKENLHAYYEKTKVGILGGGR